MTRINLDDYNALIARSNKAGKSSRKERADYVSIGHESHRDAMSFNLDENWNYAGQDYETFRKFYENGRFLYYCGDEGTLIRQNRKTGARKAMSGSMRGNHYCLIVDGQKFDIAQVILKTFDQGINDYCVIEFGDGDPRNCSLRNMKVHLPRENYLDFRNDYIMSRPFRKLGKLMASDSYFMKKK